MEVLVKGSDGLVKAEENIRKKAGARD
ncbi:hypothetical protein PMYN1_Chma162 (chromatophore) [Paulinella micropora]|uniref:Uncharacterized protein n=1 Tax=Paulinella micropora TaxID=1928728 RepID=A0A5K7VYV3_9EUKA|nr:hypothetical protein PMYN1_Chma162 [Paulinella micropora]